MNIAVEAKSRRCGMFSPPRLVPLRTITRLIWLLAEFALAAFTIPFWWRRERWLQIVCQRLLRVFRLRLQSVGRIPARGLLVSNHLTYLDILVLGAFAPARFIAKREVMTWPVLGWLALFARTIFVDRKRRLRVGRSCAQIQKALDRGALVVLFPEGTSSSGDCVLPFKSALFAPAASLDCPITAACIRYTLEDGSVPDEVCYWGDMILVPHLLNLLGKGQMSARVVFEPGQARSTNRKELARQLHAQVMWLNDSEKIEGPECDATSLQCPMIKTI